MRKSKIIIHFNKQRANKGYPWTVHYKKACIPAKKVIMYGSFTTEWKPEKKSNPRAFIVGWGLVANDKGTLHCYGG